MPPTLVSFTDFGGVQPLGVGVASAVAGSVTVQDGDVLAIYTSVPRSEDAGLLTVTAGAGELDTLVQGREEHLANVPSVAMWIGGVKAGVTSVTITTGRTLTTTATVIFTAIWVFKGALPLADKVYTNSGATPSVPGWAYGILPPRGAVVMCFTDLTRSAQPRVYRTNLTITGFEVSAVLNAAANFYSSYWVTTALGGSSTYGMNTPAFIHGLATANIQMAPQANPASQTITIANTAAGAAAMSWIATPSQPWMTLTPTSGTTPAGGTSTVTVQPVTDTLDPGIYTDTIEVVVKGAANTPQIIPVIFDVQTSAGPVLPPLLMAPYRGR